ncbi:acyl carrier protein [Lentzea sp. NPDC058436]|uniref:acyl carrier protein n=1 Tax=Lentzea sp. NPDC058436 TaxID=3346499 RepID=UPI00366A29FE
MSDRDDEELVLEFLRTALRRPDLTPDDDFFDAGGHSLMVAQVIARLKSQHGLVISAKAFVADPRIGAIVRTATRAG